MMQNDLLHWRKRRGLSLATLSVRLASEGCYVSSNTLNRWEKGETRMAPGAIDALCKVLKISESDLFPSHAQPESVIPIATALPLDRETITDYTAHLWDLFHHVRSGTSMLSLITLVERHIRVLEQALATARPDEHRWGICALIDAWILSGRIARDRLNHHEAISRHRRALDLAIEADSSDHIAGASFRLAESLKDAGLLYDAWAYCQAGIARTTGANARVRRELLGLAAEIQGKLGHHQSSRTLAAEAARLAPGAQLLPTAGGVNYSETAAASYQVIVALQEGDIAAALEHNERAHALLAIEHPGNYRWQAHLWIARAWVAARGQDLEQAADALRTAVTIARSISSDMATRVAQTALHDMLSAYRDPPVALQTLADTLAEPVPALLVVNR